MENRAEIAYACGGESLICQFGDCLPRLSTLSPQIDSLRFHKWNQAPRTDSMQGLRSSYLVQKENEKKYVVYIITSN